MKIAKRSYAIRRDDNTCIYLVPMVRRDEANLREADEWVASFRRSLRARMAARRFWLRWPGMRGRR